MAKRLAEPASSRSQSQSQSQESWDDPLSAVASSSTTPTGTLRPSSPVANAGQTIGGTKASAIGSSVGQHYLDLKALQVPFAPGPSSSPSSPSRPSHPVASLDQDSSAHLAETSLSNADDSFSHHEPAYSDTGNVTPRSSRLRRRRSRSPPAWMPHDLQTPRPQINGSPRLAGTQHTHSSPERYQSGSRSPTSSRRLRPRASRASLWTEEGDAAHTSGVESPRARTAFLVGVHELPDDELERYIAPDHDPLATLRRPSRPPLQPVLSDVIRTLSSPELPNTSRLSPSIVSSESPQSSPRPSGSSGAKLCKELSKALSDSLSQLEEIRIHAESLEQQLDVQQRTYETREKAIRTVCAQHRLSKGVLDRAISRALAEMPQAFIDAQKQIPKTRTALSLPPTTPAPKGQLPKARADSQTPSHRGLPLSLQEAMYDNVGDSSLSSIFRPDHASSLSPKASPATASVSIHSVHSGDPSPSRERSATLRRRPSWSPSVASSTAASLSSNWSQSVYGTEGPRGLGRRRPSARAAEGLMPWSGIQGDRKASATTQATSPAAVEADGYFSDSGHRPVLATSASAPASTVSETASTTRGGYYNFFTWGRKKVPHEKKQSVADGSKPRSNASDRTAPSSVKSLTTTKSTDAVLTVQPELSRTSSGNDVISALYEAIGPEPHNGHSGLKLDLKALPKPSHLRAIFLSTRILGGDSSSILVQRATKTSALVSELAYALVSDARTSGLEVREPVKQASSKVSRLRRGSVGSKDSKEPERRLKAGSDGQRPVSMAVQAAEAVIEASGRPEKLSEQSRTVRKPESASTKGRGGKIEPNVTRLPQLFGGLSGALETPSASRSHSQAAQGSAADAEGSATPKRPSAPPVELDSITSAQGQPPTLALFAGRPRRFGTPRARSGHADSDGEKSGDEFEVYGGKGNVTVPEPVSSRSIGFDDRAVDIFGFVYDATPADFRLLRQARKASTPAPATLTGVRIGNVFNTDQADEQSGDEDDDESANEVKALQDAQDTSGLDQITSAGGVTVPQMDDSDGESDWAEETTSAKKRAGHPVDLLGSAHAAKPVTGASVESATSPDITAAPSIETAASVVTKKPTSHSIRHLLDQLKTMHAQNQEEQVRKWDVFIAHRRETLALKTTEGLAVGGQGAEMRRQSTSASGRQSTAAQLGGPKSGLEDEYNFGLVGLRLMGEDKVGREDHARFLQLCREGIPLAYRPKIWSECSGANEVAEPGRYQDLLDEHQSATNQCLTQIDLDVHRTMPTNIYFGGDGPGVAKLRRLLVAYSWYNPEVGYCQGMNNLAATLLLTHATEEEAFYVFVCIMERILPSDYFTANLLVSQADQRVLIELVSELLPSLSAHLSSLGVDLPAVTFAWFLSLYTDCLPVETLFRIWDLLFSHGSIILFRTALSILVLHQPLLLSVDSASGFYSLLRSITSRLFNVDRLVGIACGADLKRDVTEEKVQRKREAHVKALKGELGIE